MQIQLTVSEDYADARLDLFLKDQAGDDLSRSTVQKWIESGWVRDAETEEILGKNGLRLRADQKLNIQLQPKAESHLEPIPMDIPVLYEEEEFMVVHKKPGIAVHSGPGDDQPSLANGLLYQFQQLSSVGGNRRPGIVHRLDKPTEGVLLIAKSDRAHAKLSAAFQNRQVEKTYQAWVLQSPVEGQGTMRLPIGRHPVDRVKMCIRETGRDAITHYKTEQIVQTQTGRKYSFLTIQIETGRTHQIRVHLQHLHCPVVGDSLYSRSAKDYAQFGLLLLAKKIKFPHPFSPEQYLEVEIDLPDRFKTFERKCRSY
ncbi:23S RNA-specific pseudouridylate synthase [Leptospira ryugenii]|uniref:Pseudouridine synthase n=1 Tax=Leptospira ryugenii TaxID=1917863 RepID=A0A2P2E427_9LEPT|nr:RluA family pseudouridine synthase [Leptospira ryugenii]GBF51635.1 23S RNA-specific pseudouridylate synthase [Leptospira ryugenii]